MIVEMSLAESLMNAIAHGRVWRVQFSRKHGSDPGDERRTFEDLNKVIANNIDGAKRAAREQGFREYNEKRQEMHAEIQQLRALIREALETHATPGWYAKARALVTPESGDGGGQEEGGR